MAGKIQDRGQMRGVLASLKGAWKRVAGRKSDHSASVEAPEPAELQTSVDEAPVAEYVEEAPAAPDYAVADATPAEGGVEDDSEDAEGVADIEKAAAPAAAFSMESVADEAPFADEIEEELTVEASPEPVSEPLEVASEEAAKVVKAPKAAKTAKTPATSKVTTAAKAKAVKEDAAASSPFIAPVTADGGPDSSWTVAQLRALAKERGVRGYSSMSKAQLLGSLNGPQA